MTKIERFLLPDEMQPVSHYCHVTSAGNHVWVSGTVGVRSDGSIPNDVTEQFDDLAGSKLGEKNGYEAAMADGVVTDEELEEMHENGLKGFQLEFTPGGRR